MKMLNVKEMQEILRIGRDKAYALMHSRAFPSIKIGGRYFVEAEALEEWLQKQRFREYKI